EQEVARENAASVLDQHREKLELAAGERYFPTLRVEQATRRDVELPLGKPVPRPRRFCGPRRRGERSAQHRLDAGQELAQVERLGDVVVGADLEADHLIDRIAAAGDDD